MLRRADPRRVRPSGARMVKCKYTLLITAPSYESAFARIAQRLEDEVVVEGTLHVTTVQAGSCMDRYGNMQNMQKRTAPPLASLANALVQDSSVGDSQLLQEAVCLATPPDNPSESQRGAGYVMRQVRSAQADIRRGVASDADELAYLETEACQRTALFHMHAQEVLQASRMVQRKRRRALLRAVRAGRSKAQALLQDSATVLSSLVSWDGEEDKQWL